MVHAKESHLSQVQNSAGITYNNRTLEEIKKANEDKKAKKLFSISTRILKDTEANFRLNIICLRKIVVILVFVRNLGQ